MVWVPPYNTDLCMSRLDQSFGEMRMKDGLSHLGLQFWRPVQEGQIELVDDFKTINDSTIINFRNWGNVNNVRVLLCIYNGTREGWNWNLAKNAFDTNRKQFIKALVAETVRLQLDGVDIDFEGKGNRNSEKKAFFEFIKELSIALKDKGKELTVDSFAHKWNAPNQGWWKMMLPHVDALHVMGYTETGSRSTGWKSYDFLKATAGKYSSKLLIGVPSNTSHWEKASVKEHLKWVAKDPSVGLAIWDAQLKDSKWRTEEVWKMIAGIRKGVDFNDTDLAPIVTEQKQEIKFKNQQNLINEP
jgi:GH18 family chitinase